MFRSGSIQSHLTLRDKLFSLDLVLVISMLLYLRLLLVP